MESLGWRAWDGEPGMESLVWRAWDGKPGMKSLRWRACDGEPGIESLKNDEFLWVDIQEWRAWRALGGKLGFILEWMWKGGFKKSQISILSYLFNFYFIFLASFTKYHM